MKKNHKERWKSKTHGALQGSGTFHNLCVDFAKVNFPVGLPLYVVSSTHQTADTSLGGICRAKWTEWQKTTKITTLRNIGEKMLHYTHYKSTFKIMIKFMFLKKK